MFEVLGRVDAGRRLGQRLAGLSGRHVVVLALSRGGVPVAAKVAATPNALLDVIVVLPRVETGQMNPHSKPSQRVSEG